MHVLPSRESRTSKVLTTDQHGKPQVQKLADLPVDLSSHSVHGAEWALLEKNKLWLEMMISESETAVQKLMVIRHAR